MSEFYHEKASEFAPGMRVEIHPSTDLWMRGARYGTVVRVVGRKVHVRLDKRVREWSFAPDLLAIVEG